MAVVVCRHKAEVHTGEIAGGAASARFAMLPCCCMHPSFYYTTLAATQNSRQPLQHAQNDRWGGNCGYISITTTRPYNKTSPYNVTSPCNNPLRYTLHYPRCIVVASRPPAAYHPHRRCLSGFIVHVHGHGHYTNSPVSDTNCHTCLVHASLQWHIVACAVDDSIGI